MIVRAARAGLTITEVPAPYAIRQGESKLSTMRDGWRHLRFLLLAAPDYLFILPASLFEGKTNYADIEFLIYLNFFLRQQTRTRIAGTSRHVRSLR